MMAAILNSAILVSAILCKKNFTCSFWLNWMMAAILNSAILVSAILHKKFYLFILTQLDDDSHLEFCHVGFSHCHLGFRHLVIFCQIHSKTLKNTLTPFWSWLKLVQSESNSFILTQIDDGSHLEFCHLELGHLGFSHFSSSSHTHSHLPRSVPYISTKKLHSFILTQLDDGSHLEFCHVGFSHLTQKNSLIHSDPTSCWQPSWILPCWIQTLPSRIQTPCYLLSDSLKNTLSPFWLWLKLIQSV